MQSLKFDATFSVSELTDLIKQTLETCFKKVSVEGEVSGYKKNSSGHIYFTLKDAGAAISCCIWKSKAAFLPFSFNDGDHIVVTGSISVYEPRGTYQIICDKVQKIGVGDILVELERRKREYEKQGLFDSSRKKPIPKRPAKVGVITSATGAAFHDIMNVMTRRNSSIDIILLPAAVQGPNAAMEVSRRIQQANEFCVADVLIVGRGGGAIEDLLPFSDDKVVRAIAESQIPIISAVGHEIDNMLSDFVADLRAPTPSAAAELVCANQEDQRALINNLKKSLCNNIGARIKEIRLLSSNYSLEAVKLNLGSRLNTLRLKTDNYSSALQANMNNKVALIKQKIERLDDNNKYLINKAALESDSRFKAAVSKLKALSPLSILDRGYSIVLDKNQKAVREEIGRAHV